jgi:uncharacterized protein YjbI with pentapeptide repeats
MNATVVAAIVAGGLTLIGTIAAQILGRNTTNRALERQTAELHDQLQHQRSLLLNERFATAVGQLGSESSAVRLAGVYAMAGLADDWVENRQTYVDVLCAYLRIPTDYPGDATPDRVQRDYAADREVRHTVIRLITAHLKDGAAVSWQGLNFDFTGVVFDGGDFSEARFSGGTVSFSGADFSGGEVSFHGAKFCGADVSFNDAKFSGAEVDFLMTEFSGGTVGFYSAKFSGAAVSFGGEFSGAAVRFQGAEFSGGTVVFGSRFSGGIVVFSVARFSGGTVRFAGARFSGGTVTFNSAFTTSSIGPDGRERTLVHVTISGAEFCGADVSFNNAWFSGGTVDFEGAQFSGGTVDFSGAEDWSCRPKFPWTDTPPPGVKLPRKEDQPQA